MVVINIYIKKIVLNRVFFETAGKIFEENIVWNFLLKTLYSITDRCYSLTNLNMLQHLIQEKVI